LVAPLQTGYSTKLWNVTFRCSVLPIKTVIQIGYDSWP